MPSQTPEFGFEEIMVKRDYYSPTQLTWQRFNKHHLAKISLWMLLVLTCLVFIMPAIFKHTLGLHYYTVNLDERFSAPSLKHPAGTDELGRDVITRLFSGGRISITIAFLSAIISLLFGSIIGAMAGYYGGWVDTLLMRFTDGMIALPTLPLMILLAAIDLQKLFPDALAWMARGNFASLIKLMIIIVFFGWMTVARLVRGEFLSLREREFILASRAMGNHHQKIIWFHMLPNCMAPMIVATTLSIGNIILYEAVLSFLGLGIQPPIPSWGNMLHYALDYVRNAPLLAVLPGFFILITVISINFVGDGLRDALDPRHS